MNTLRRALAKTVSSEWKRQGSLRGLQSYSTKRSDSPPTPRPGVIPYQTKVANSVNLIGRVDQPIEFKASPDGNYCAAATVISQRRTSTSSPGRAPFFIPVVFEGDLAHVATCHLKKNDHVCVAGQIAAGPPPLDLMQDHLKDGDDVPIAYVVHVLLEGKLQNEIPTVSENKYRAQIDALRTELTEKAEAMQYLEMFNQMLITKEFTSNQELQEARKETVLGIEGVLTDRTALRIKRMGQIDCKAFKKTCLLKYPNEDWEDISAKLCSTWDENVKNPHWHPFKKDNIGGKLCEIIDDDDEKLKELRKEFGNSIYI